MSMRTIVIVSILSAVITAAGAYVLLFSSKNTSAPHTNEPSELTSTTQTTTNDTTAQPGEYVIYSEELAASTGGTKLLFFHAPWCPQCRALDEDITQSTLPANTTIFKVDYDTNQKLRQKYGVIIQTTIVRVDDHGNKVDSYVAYDEPTLASVESELLP